jgi:hypothetical protein
VKNGTLGTVESIEGSRLSVRIDAGPGEAGRSVAFDARDYGHVAHGYAATVHKSQGVTVERAHVLASRYMDRHAAYVGMTRHRDRADLYFGAEEFKDTTRLAHRLSRDGGKDTTLDYLTRDVSGQPVTAGLRAAVAEFRRTADDNRPEAAVRAQTASDRGTSDRKVEAPVAAKEEKRQRPSDILTAMLNRMTPTQRAGYEQRQAQQAADGLRRELDRQRRPDEPRHRL